MFRSIGRRRRGFGKGEFLGVRLVTVVVMVGKEMGNFPVFAWFSCADSWFSFLWVIVAVGRN